MHCPFAMTRASSRVVVARSAEAIHERRQQRRVHQALAETRDALRRGHAQQAQLASLGPGDERTRQRRAQAARRRRWSAASATDGAGVRAAPACRPHTLPFQSAGAAPASTRRTRASRRA